MADPVKPNNSPMRTFRSVVSAVSTLVLVACAVTTTVLLVRRPSEPSTTAARQHFSAQPDWLSYVRGGHRIGPSDAKVVLVEFGDFQCPACQSLEATLRETRKRYPRDVAILYRHFPLTIHPAARSAALASECAAQQGMFETMHAALFDNRDSLGTISWTRFAAKAKVPNLRSFDMCMRDTIAMELVTADERDAKRLGARGTPTVLINSVRFTGALPQRTLDSLVESAIRRAR